MPAKNKKDLQNINTAPVYAEMAEAIAPAPKRRGRPVKPAETKLSEMPRFNLSLDPELNEYLRQFADFNHMTTTDYLRELIRQDYARNEKLYRQFLALQGERKK